MKVAGGLLLALGGILIAVAIMLGNETGRSSPGTMIIGVILLVLGLIVCMLKPKGR